MDAAEECGARVGHACGGNLACSTCHVWVHAGLDSLGEVADVDLVVEITEESHRAWLDENPDERKRTG